MVLFPRKGDRLRAHSVFFQATRVTGAGKGIVSGMAPSRASSSSVAIAAGTWSDGYMPTSYAGGTISGFSAASSGMHRYDLIVLDTSTGVVSRVAGSENLPTLSTDFLENLQPIPPELVSENQVLIAIVIVTSSGIPTGNFGHYATGGVANMISTVLNPNVKGVTNGDNHDHSGGDGSQIDHGGLAGLADNDHPQYIKHSLATAVNDFLVASGPGVFIKKTLAEIKTILGLGSAAYTASSDYAPAAHASNTSNPHGTTYGQVGAEPANANIQSHIANGSNPHSTTYGQVGAAPANQGVTNGNSHDHSGGDGAQIAYSSLSGKPIRRFTVPFTYGDGYSVVQPSTEVASTEVEIPVACTIIAARIHERSDTTGNILVKLWKRTYSGSWSLLDEFTITGGIRYEETGLSISLNAGDWITAEVSTVSTMKQITCSLTCEAV